MKDLILDETTTINSNYSNHIIKYIGIGIFVWIAIATFAHTLKYLTKNGLLMTGVEPVVVYTATITIYFLAIIGAALFTVKRISRMQLNDTRTVKSLLVKSVIIVVILTLIQFLVSFYFPLYSDVFFESTKQYRTLLENYNLELIELLADAIDFVIVGLIFWKAK